MLPTNIALDWAVLGTFAGPLIALAMRAIDVQDQRLGIRTEGEDMS
jgi:hypothetical protein